MKENYPFIKKEKRGRYSQTHQPFFNAVFIASQVNKL